MFSRCLYISIYLRIISKNNYNELKNEIYDNNLYILDVTYIYNHKVSRQVGQVFAL